MPIPKKSNKLDLELSARERANRVARTTTKRTRSFREKLAAAAAARLRKAAQALADRRRRRRG